jgi:uncharacterized protein YbjT (DUF2867 family)
MKYIITGGAGHTAKIIAAKLLAAGKDVTVVGRNAEHLKELGAKTAIGSLEDGQFLKEIFFDADVVYTLIPPNDTADNLRAYQQRVGANFHHAIKESKVKYVVNLSSMGAHLKDNAGLVNGLADFEALLNTLPDVHVKHLRPGLFFYNQLKQIPTIKAMSIMGANYAGDVVFPLVDPVDVAAVAVEELLSLSFRGKSSRYIVSEETTPDEFVKVLSAAIGEPDLKWVCVPDAQLKAAMLKNGVIETMADALLEMGQAIGSGQYVADYLLNKPSSDFAKVFAAAYNN